MLTTLAPAMCAASTLSKSRKRLSKMLSLNSKTSVASLKVQLRSRTIRLRVAEELNKISIFLRSNHLKLVELHWSWIRKSIRTSSIKSKSLSSKLRLGTVVWHSCRRNSSDVLTVVSLLSRRMPSLLALPWKSSLGRSLRFWWRWRSVRAQSSNWEIFKSNFRPQLQIENRAIPISSFELRT